MKDLLTVKQVAERLQKSEETIKRWIRSGKFPNAFKKTDRDGWKIPQQDLQIILKSIKQLPPKRNITNDNELAHQSQDNASKEIILLAFQAVTMSSPTETMINILNHVGIKRTLEILLIMRQSPQKVKNPEGFIKKAISNGWTTSTLPIKRERNISRRVRSDKSDNYIPKVPFYNWLEED